MEAAKMTQLKATYRPEIDGLRALAVAAVIINHFNKNLLPSGYLGVDIFFVISGFVITSSMARNAAISPPRSFANFLLSFYSRRIKRLFPALIVVVICGATAIALVDPDPGTSLLTGICALFGVSNIYLVARLTDYFSASTDLNIFLHTWSLGVEEQFYFLFPFLVWVSGFGRGMAGGARRLTWLLTPLIVTSMIAFIVIYPRSQPHAYFLITTRFWELACGAVLSLTAHQNLLRRIPAPPALLVLSALIGLLFFPLKAAVVATLLCTALSCLLIHALNDGGRAYLLLSSKPIVYIGVLSYSLYLWHWPVLALSRWTIGIHTATIPFQILLICLLAWASYQAVEKPLRHSPWPTTRTLTLLLAAMASLASSSWLALLGLSVHSYLFLGKRNLLQDRFASFPGRSAEICNLFDDPISVEQFPMRCGLEGLPNSHNIYLLGDSQIEQFSKPLAAVSNLKGYGFHGIWGNACPFPALDALSQSGHHGRRKRCLDGQRAAESTAIQAIKPGDIVFMGSYLTANFDPNNQLLDGNTEQVRKQYIIDVLKIAETFHARGAAVVIYLNGPRFTGLEGTIEGYCTPQWFKPLMDPSCSVAAEAFLAPRRRDFAALYQWADGDRRIIWDGVDETTCGPTNCQAQHYKDEAHFRSYYANYLVHLFMNRHASLFDRQPKSTPLTIESPSP